MNLFKAWSACREKGWKKTLLYLLLGTYLISFSWYVKTKIRCLISRKIKVGFGPIASGEDDLAERKWRIDPIINAINQLDSNYCAGFFCSPAEMKNFDIVIIVKKFNPSFIPFIQKLKSAKKQFIYDIVDNPNDQEKYRFYFRHHLAFTNLLDGYILSTPVHRQFMHQVKKRNLLIEHPIINPDYKTSYLDHSEIRLLAQGYASNLQNLKWIESYLPYLSQKAGKPVRLYYHSEEQGIDTEYVKHINWSVKNSFELMKWADIAITMKDLHRLHQYTKPSTKVIAFMAAGLPVICKPSPADLLVIEHQVTGFFAYTLDDWLQIILHLSSSCRLRKQIGYAARCSVESRFSIEQATNKYISLLDQIRIDKELDEKNLSSHSESNHLVESI